MYRWLSAKKLALWTLCLALFPTGAKAAEPLAFGVFPYMNPQRLIEFYRPLVAHLDAAIGRNVVLYSAPDFATFAQRTRKGEYDLLLTAPHLAWLAREEAGYRPLLKYKNPVTGLVVVRKDDPLPGLAGLAGRRISMPDSAAIVTLAAKALLADAGLVEGRDYQSVAAGTHNNALSLLVNGRADAALLSEHSWNLNGGAATTRIVARTAPLSSLVFLAHPRLNDAQAKQLVTTLLEFSRGPDGQHMLKRGHYDDLVEPDGSELDAFRRYAPATRALIGDTP